MLEVARRIGLLRGLAGPKVVYDDIVDDFVAVTHVTVAWAMDGENVRVHDVGKSFVVSVDGLWVSSGTDLKRLHGKFGAIQVSHSGNRCRTVARVASRQAVRIGSRNITDDMVCP